MRDQRTQALAKMAIVDAALSRDPPATIAEACAEAGITTRTRDRWLKRGVGVKVDTETASALAWIRSHPGVEITVAEVIERRHRGEMHCRVHGWLATSETYGALGRGCAACNRARALAHYRARTTTRAGYPRDPSKPPRAWRRRPSSI